MDTKPACYALVPAAGGGSRMGSDIPKQYLPLAGQPLIWHTLGALCGVTQIKKVFVVLAPDDREWDRHDWSALGSKLAVHRCGGATRAASVANGLAAIEADIGAQDWVLVHDAARACISPELVNKLIAEVGDDATGGILALPVADTLKQSLPDGRIERTVPRDGLWQAQTPQMFRYALLRRALAATSEVTDEAGAVEALGLHPKLVAGDIRNLKVTWPADMQLAELILQAKGKGDQPQSKGG